MSASSALRATTQLHAHVVRYTARCQSHRRIYPSLAVSEKPGSNSGGTHCRWFTGATIRSQNVQGPVARASNTGTSTPSSTPQQEPPPAFIASILVNDPENINSEDFNELGQSFDPGSQTPFIIVLVTPYLAKLIDPSNDFIPETILRRFAFQSVHTKAYVLTAVVDEIPNPSKFRPYQAPEGVFNCEGFTRGGSEGISLYVSGSEEESTKIWDDIQSTTTLDPGLQSSNGTLSFAVHGAEDRLGAYSSSYTMKLPLANTLFQNGKAFTLSAQRWDIRPTPLRKVSSSAENKITLVQSKNLLHKTVSLQSSAQHKGIPPLCYRMMAWLTPFRIVDGSMGNVLRSLKVSKDTPDVMPASRELESAIPAFIEDQESPLTYELWAHVVPREIWTGTPQLWWAGGLWPDYVGMGHRFHRVLSGGGGWGTNKGLIALDAESGFGAACKESDTDDMPYDGLFPQTCRPGDAVRFVAIVGRSHVENEYARKSQRFPNKKAGCLSTSEARIQMGCLPSSRYQFGSSARRLEHQTQVTASISDGAKPSVLLVRGLFGALSQNDASVSLDLQGPATAKFDNTDRVRNITATKLPPYTNFEYFTEKDIRRIYDREVLLP